MKFFFYKNRYPNLIS